jgi:hypothetical protein
MAGSGKMTRTPKTHLRFEVSLQHPHQIANLHKPEHNLVLTLGRFFDLPPQSPP